MDVEADAANPGMRNPNVPLAEIEHNEDQKIVGPWILPRNLWIILRYKIPGAILHGSSVDIHKMQAGTGKEADRRKAMYERATQYPNETEHLFR
jgi:sodium-dependent phosphate transporter